MTVDLHSIRQRGLTLIEMMIVVSILGILSAIVYPTFTDIQEEAKINATIADLTAMKTAFMLYQQDNGQWPRNAKPEVMPVGLEDYLPPDAFSTTPPIGGRYDCAPGLDRPKIIVRIISSQVNKDLDLWQEIDSRIDDGDLSTGTVFRKGRNLAYMISAE